MTHEFSAERVLVWQTGAGGDGDGEDDEDEDGGQQTLDSTREVTDTHRLSREFFQCH